MMFGLTVGPRLIFYSHFACRSLECGLFKFINSNLLEIPTHLLTIFILLLWISMPSLSSFNTFAKEFNTYVSNFNTCFCCGTVKRLINSLFFFNSVSAPGQRDGANLLSLSPRVLWKDDFRFLAKLGPENQNSSNVVKIVLSTFR